MTKLTSILSIILILSSCGSDRLYSQDSGKFKKYVKPDLDVERILSIQGGGSFNLPNYPTPENGYMIMPQVDTILSFV